MTKQSKFIFDPTEQTVRFRGACAEVLHICQAMCCRMPWYTPLTLEEYKSGLYDSIVICSFADRECSNIDAPCINKRYQLNKGKDGVCKYLDRKNECSIHSHKPQNCKEFSCANGWKIKGVVPIRTGNPLKEKGDLEIDTFARSMDDAMVFVFNTQFELKTVINLEGERKMLLIGKWLSCCDFHKISIDFNCPEMDYNKVCFLFNLFNGENNLGAVYKKLSKKYKFRLPWNDYCSFIYLLYKCNFLIAKC